MIMPKFYQKKKKKKKRKLFMQFNFVGFICEK